MTNQDRLERIPLSKIRANHDQPRNKEGSPGAISKLVESIKELGVLEPIIVVESGDHYDLVAGHRRVEACIVIKSEDPQKDTIPAIILDTLDRAQQLARLMAENTVREDLTTLEEAKGIQMMIDLGFKQSTISRVTGRKATDIKFAKSITAGAKKIEKHIAEIQPSFEEAAALIEFADDKYKRNRLLDSVGTGSFKHDLAWAREQREKEAKTKAAHDKLQKAGIPIIDEYDYKAVNLVSFPTYGISAMTPEAHTSCPGHAASISYDGRIVYKCTQPKLHGLKTSSTGSTTDKELDKKKRESRARFKIARLVRLDYITNLIKITKSIKENNLSFIAEIAWDHGFQTFAAKAVRELLEEMTPKSPTPAQKLLVRAIQMGEEALYVLLRESAAIDTKNWGYEREIKKVQTYYGFLKSTGYTLAECEQTLKGDGKNDQNRT